MIPTEGRAQKVKTCFLCLRSKPEKCWLTNYGSTHFLYSHALRGHDRIKHMRLNLRIKEKKTLTGLPTGREHLTNVGANIAFFFLLF